MHLYWTNIKVDILYAPCITITLWYKFHMFVFVYAFWKNMDIESRKSTNSIDERTQKYTSHM